MADNTIPNENERLAMVENKLDSWIGRLLDPQERMAVEMCDLKKRVAELETKMALVWMATTEGNIVQSLRSTWDKSVLNSRRIMELGDKLSVEETRRQNIWDQIVLHGKRLSAVEAKLSPAKPVPGGETHMPITAPSRSEEAMRLHIKSITAQLKGANMEIERLQLAQAAMEARRNAIDYCHYTEDGTNYDEHTDVELQARETECYEKWLAAQPKPESEAT